MFTGRTDGRELTAEWMARKQEEGRRADFVTTAGDFRAVDPQNTDYLLGKKRID